MGVGDPKTHPPLFLDGLTYPATRAEVVSYAEENEAATQEINLARSLPARTYWSAEEVWRNLGEAERQLGMGLLRDPERERGDLGEEAIRRRPRYWHP